MSKEQREGIIIEKPQRRLSDEQIRLIDSVSRELLWEPGLVCYNNETAKLFKAAGATVEPENTHHRIRVPNNIIDKALESAPSKIILGAREKQNRLILDAQEPRVRFGTGSETNIWLDVSYEDDNPVFQKKNGSIELLKKSAHLCENLENCDFFIRNVNIQDPEIDSRNKDVNKFLASLNNITKHVQGGLTDLEALDDVIRMGEIIAGGKDAFKKNPIVSFITCVIKSPLQVVDDTASKLIAIAKRQVPVVISSCPMGGATGPFDEFGMVAQINAEVLAGIIITQLASPGAPVLYGAVPVRTRLDNLNDMYGAPEVANYTVDCTQMSRFYNVPCYSTAGVADTVTPGIQATVEKLITLMTVPSSGAHYIHYAFGLLDRTSMFCPQQAVMDDAHIGIVKRLLRKSDVNAQRRDEVLAMIREVMNSDHKTYIYHLPLPTVEPVYIAYPLEAQGKDALFAANEKYEEILGRTRNTLPDEVKKEIAANIDGVLEKTLQ